MWYISKTFIEDFYWTYLTDIPEPDFDRIYDEEIKPYI